MYFEYKNIQAVGFKSNDKYYIYDRYSNYVIEVDNTIYTCLDDFYTFNIVDIVHKYSHIFSKTKLEVAFDTVKTYQEEYAVLLPFIIPKFNGINSQRLEEILNNQLSIFTFNLTEDCNFRCTYCFYSGEYDSHKRHNPNNYMTWEVAQKAIDYFILRNSKSKFKAMRFFGGEPLLNFEIITKIVEYTSKKDRDIVFALTTNGSLLKGNILKYLIDANVHITISLDGNKSIHDKNRKFKSLKGSYDVVFNNINNVRNIYPDYFRKVLRINSVLTPADDVINKIDSYFVKDNFPNGFTQEIVLPSKNEFYSKNSYSSFYNDYTDNFLNIYKKMHISGFESLMEIPLHLTSNELHRKMLLFHWRDSSSFDKKLNFWPDGLCIPGTKEIFVTPNGDFYPCDKVYYRDQMMIGNINDGISVDLVNSYINNYLEDIYKDCSICWTYRLCKACFREMKFGNKKDADAERFNYCTNFKKQIIKVITTYCEIIESNPKAFSVYE